MFRCQEQQLSRWDSIYSDIQTVHQVEQMPPTSFLNVPLPELADWWFVAELAYLPNDPVPDPFVLLEDELKLLGLIACTEFTLQPALTTTSKF